MPYRHTPANRIILSVQQFYLRIPFLLSHTIMGVTTPIMINQKI